MIESRLKWIICGIEWSLLTPWEEKFIEDVEAYFKRKGDLTDKQEEILERIYKEKSR
jgi:hypothetical protein